MGKAPDAVKTRGDEEDRQRNAVRSRTRTTRTGLNWHLAMPVLSVRSSREFRNVADAPTSKSLLAKARDCSDQSAWRRLTELYEPLIERWVRPHVAQRADAEDVVQEVLTTLVRELPRFDHNQRPGAFRAWLRTITVHRLQAYWEKRDARQAAAGGADQREALASTGRSGQRALPFLG